MFAAPFEYHAPDDLDAVLDLLAEYGDEATLLGGGQSLVPMMALRLAMPEILVDLGRLERDEIRVEDGQLVIPGSARHVDILNSPLVAEHAPMLRTAGAHIGNVRVRNRGTIGGSLAHADPAAEWPCVVSALGATIQLTSRNGTRDVSPDEFFESYMMTTREPEEVLTEVRIPVAAGRRQAFVEMTKRANDFAVVEVAVTASLDDGSFEDVMVAFGGVADRPVTFGEAERQALRGARPGDSVVVDTIEAFTRELDPPQNVHGTTEYRRRLAQILTLRAVELAASA